MNTPNDVIAHSLSASHSMMKMLVEDLQPPEYLHRPTPKANCAAWLLGHLTLTERRGLALAGAADLPALPEGFEKRFSREEGAPQQAEFGDTSILWPLLDQHRARLVEAVRAVPPERLGQPLEKPHPRFKSVGEMLNFLALHSTMHAGQISIIRRSLGRPPVV